MSNSTSHKVRRALLVIAGCTAVTMVAACGGGDGGSPPASSGGASSGAPSSAAHQDVITSVTAQNVQCPAGTPGKGKPAITFGSKNFAEQFTLGELYTQTLKSRGYNVKYQSNIGGSEVIDKAFQSGEIDAYAEYLGEIETSIAGGEVGKAPEATYNTAKQFEEQKRDATLFKQTPFENTDVLITTPDFAKKHNLKSVADLAKVGDAGSEVTLAAQPPFETRFNGLKGMKSEYGLTGVKFTGVDPGLQYKVLDQGQANVADAFSTDGQLNGDKYVTLDDPKHIFGYQYVAPVVKKSVAQAQGPEFQQTLDCVSSLLTTDVMRALNKQVQINGGDPAEVAKKFLTANKVLA